MVGGKCVLKSLPLSGALAEELERDSAFGRVTDGNTIIVVLDNHALVAVDLAGVLPGERHGAIEEHAHRFRLPAVDRQARVIGGDGSEDIVNLGHDAHGLAHDPVEKVGGVDSIIEEHPYIGDGVNVPGRRAGGDGWVKEEVNTVPPP